MGHGGGAAYSAYLDTWRLELAAAAQASCCAESCSHCWEVRAIFSSLSTLKPAATFICHDPIFSSNCFFNCLTLLLFPYQYCHCFFFCMRSLDLDSWATRFFPPLSLCNHCIYFLLGPEWVTLRCGLVVTSKRTGHSADADDSQTTHKSNSADFCG